MEIKKMNLQNLRNEEHFQFMTDMKGLFQATNLQPLNVELLVDSFMNLFEQENKTIEAIRKSGLTVSVTDADNHRDSIFRGFVLFVEASSHSDLAQKAYAAHNIQVVIDHYGDFRNKPYNEETASITNFLQDIHERCSNDIATLNASEWTDTLSTTNQAFNALMDKRFDENLGQITFNMREIRKDIDATYNQLVKCVNAFNLLNGSGTYAEFTERVNNRVDYFKNTLMLRKSKTTAKKEDTTTM